MTKQEIPFWIVATLITLAVVIIGAAVIYGRSLVRLDREKKALHRQRVEDAEREEMMKENAEAWQRGEPPIRIKTDIGVDSHAYRKAHADDTTRILPGREP